MIIKIKLINMYLKLDLLLEQVSRPVDDVEEEEEAGDKGQEKLVNSEENKQNVILNDCLLIRESKLTSKVAIFAFE